MTKEDKVKELIRNHVRNIFLCANTTHFALSVDFETPGENEMFRKGSGGAAMTMRTDYEYLTAHLQIDIDYVMDLVKEEKYDGIISLLCHEVAHTITGELPDRMCIDYEDSSYYDERLTEQVGRLIHRVYNTMMANYDIDIKKGNLWLTGKKGNSKKR